METLVFYFFSDVRFSGMKLLAVKVKNFHGTLKYFF